MENKSYPSSPQIRRLQKFILWCKDNEIQLHEIDFGDLHLVITDLEVIAPEQEEVSFNKPTNNRAEPQSMYDEILSRRGIVPGE